MARSNGPHTNCSTPCNLSEPLAYVFDHPLTGPHLVPVLVALADDQPLEPRHRDHALTGDWKDHRDCHVKPDLVLIYQKPDADTLRLVRLGSHSELGL